jgi:SAM-dependent methyltransferase
VVHGRRAHSGSVKEGCVTVSQVDNGWQASAAPWIADPGESGDFGRRYVLDLVMVFRALARSPRTALDVGCGEGRFCRALEARRGSAVSARDIHLVVSYVSLIDILDIWSAITEMRRNANSNTTRSTTRPSRRTGRCRSTKSSPATLSDAATRRLYYLTSTVNLASTPMEGWKIAIATASASVAK